MTQEDASRLLDPNCYPHPAGRIELVETHISWVFLAGDYAYKVKKPIRLPFLDFSTLAARRSFCEEELRLNRRTAPDLYLRVLPITGPPENLRIGGEGVPREYALQMRRFDQDALADRLARRGMMDAARIDALAATIAGFHAGIPRSPVASSFGSHREIEAAAIENFEELERVVSGPDQLGVLERLSAWTRAESARIGPILEERKRRGFVRECHGDLHLGNIYFDGFRPVLFDCIEFNAGLRWIDVVSEVAFLVMDLRAHGLDAQAWRLRNAYSEIAADYQGLRVFNYYYVYRAMVRAKIAMIRAHQAGNDDKSSSELEAAYEQYVGLAERATRPFRPSVVLMHGLAGSGKTTVSQLLIEQCGGIRVRSDVERKRLHGLVPRARTHSVPYGGIYAPDTTRRTYQRLKNMVIDIIESGHTALVDAAFLWRAPREGFYELARDLGVPHIILSCNASRDELRRRVADREASMNDASEAGVAVLENQIVTEEPLAPDELAYARFVDTDGDQATQLARVREIAASLGQQNAAAGKSLLTGSSPAL